MTVDKIRKSDYSFSLRNPFLEGAYHPDHGLDFLFYILVNLQFFKNNYDVFFL